MAEHRTGKRQHIVPQQMIRNFAGSDGKLSEMIKPEFRIGTRRRGPKGILFQDDFYRDSVSDFDAELLTPVEQKFARVYPEVLKASRLNGHQGAAFIDWVAAMLVRTQLISAMMPTFPDGLPIPIAEQLRNAKKLLDNLGRSSLFTVYQDLFARTGWRWKFMRFPQPCLVLTDHPVGITSIFQEGGQMVVVPLAHNTALIGGARDAIEGMRDATPLDLNFFSVAWAHRYIFASDKAILEAAHAAVGDKSPFPPKLVEAARQPLFGAPQRMRERMRSASMPPNFDFGKALRTHAESFGRYKWEGDPVD
jgi:hypothetical protein